MSENTTPPFWLPHLAGFPVVVVQAVVWGDMDSYRHVNNVVYLTYVESARVAYYTALTGLTEPREFGMTLASAKLDFLKPIFFGQSVHALIDADRSPADLGAAVAKVLSKKR